MSLENQIANLVGAASALTGEVAGKMAAIDARVAAKLNELDNWRVGARNEYPARNMIDNPAFNDGNADQFPDSWAYSSYNYLGVPAGAVTLVSSALLPGSDFQGLVGKGGLNNSNLLGSIKVWEIELKNDTSATVVARVNTNLAYPLPRDYSGGVLMRVRSIGEAALQSAGVGGGAYYDAYMPYDLAKSDDWQWISGMVPAYSSSFCINFNVKPGGHCRIYLALPMAVDGVCNRVLL